jgi:hypothetical protein
VNFICSQKDGPDVDIRGLSTPYASEGTSTIFRDITPYSPLKVNRRFGGTYRFHLHGRRISRARNQRACRLLSRCLFYQLIIRSWRWRRYVPPKRPVCTLVSCWTYFFYPEDGGDVFLRNALLATCLHAGFLLNLFFRPWKWRRYIPPKRPACTLVSCRTYFFDPEDGDDMFLRKVGWHSTEYTALYPRRWHSSWIYASTLP